LNKRVIVTGGAGFIGSHLVDRLVNDGAEVVVIDDLSTGDAAKVNPKAQLIALDIRSLEAKQVIKNFRPDIIFHLAAQINLRKSLQQPLEDASINILGSINVAQSLVESAEDISRVKLIFSSTGGAIYGDVDKLPTPETTEPNPLSPYGVAKFSVEKYLNYFNKVHGLPYVALRYSNVYGPGQSTKGEAGVVAIFLEKMLAGETPVINGDGKQTRDFVFVDDVVEANIRAALSDVTGIFNIGTGRESTVLQVFNLLQQYIGKTFPEVHGPAIPGELQRSCLDFSRAMQVLEWEPKVSLEEGLDLTAKAFMSRV
jgi:UDP-glucose 4-epimerase